MSELMCCREDPPLHRDALPGVDDNGGGAILFADGHSEERVARDIGRVNLDPARLDQSTDVSDRVLRTDAQALPRLRCERHRVDWLPGVLHDKVCEPELMRLPEEILEVAKVREPACNVIEDPIPGIQSLPRPKC